MDAVRADIESQKAQPAAESAGSNTGSASASG